MPAAAAWSLDPFGPQGPLVHGPLSLLPLGLGLPAPKVQRKPEVCSGHTRRKGVRAGVPHLHQAQPRASVTTSSPPAVPRCDEELAGTRALEPVPLRARVRAPLQPQLRSPQPPPALQEGGPAAPSVSAATGLRQGPRAPAPRLPSAGEQPPPPGQGVCGPWGTPPSLSRSGSRRDRAGCRGSGHHEKPCQLTGWSPSPFPRSGRSHLCLGFPGLASQRSFTRTPRASPR